MRRVLVISHAFPPTGGSGVQRTGGFVRHLAEFGWEPIVWTAKHAPGLPRDESLLDNLPPDLIRYDRRTYHPWLLLERLAERLTSVIRKSEPGGEASQTAPWRMQRVGRWLSSLSIPDSAASWLYASILLAIRACRVHRVEALYATYSPASNLMLGWLLAKWTGLPWVADFRDLWVENYDFVENPPIRRWACRRLQRAFLRDANAVVGVSPRQTRLLADHAPGQNEKFHTITNGANPADFAGLERDSVRAELGIPARRFVVSFVGSFVQSAEAATILEGVSRFRQLNKNDDVEFRVAGWTPGDVMRLVESSPVGTTVLGYVSHDRAVREMLAADVLISGNLSNAPHSETIIAGKIFEYLASGRPIVHVEPTDSATHDILSACTGGACVQPDAASVSRALGEHLSRWKSGEPLRGCPAELSERYSRRTLTERLAGVLDALPNAANCVRDAGRNTMVSKGTSARTEVRGSLRPG